jgi:tetratricopeptide (TPR) repeat protein
VSEVVRAARRVEDDVLMGERVLALVALATLLCGSARADETVQEHYKRGLSAYGLGNYSLAASEYEKAFELDPQPALLYDAAQAHRLAGDKQRALELYQSYLSLFGTQVNNREQVAERIVALKRAIAEDARAPEMKPPKPPPVVEPRLQAAKTATPPPTKTALAMQVAPSAPTMQETPPIQTAPSTSAGAAQPNGATMAPDTLTVRREPRRNKHGLAIGLGVAGGVIVIGGALALGLVLGQHNPTASLGAVTPR